MGWFSRTTTSDVFVIQQQGHLGSLPERSTFEDLGLSIGDESRPLFVQGQRYIGSTISKKRLWLGIACIAALFAVFLARAVYLQLLQGEHYSSLAEANRFRTHRIVPPRGLVYDRQGVILAQNVPSFVLTMTIADLPKNEEERKDIFGRVSTLAGLQPADIDLALSDFAGVPFDAIPLKQGIPYETAIRLAIDLSTLPGFDLQSSSQRDYPSGIVSLSHLLGYTGKISPKELSQTDKTYRPIDTIGKIGVEKTAEAMLRGTPGEEVYEVDVHGNNLSVVSKKNPLDGSDLHLSLDADFQKYIESQLQETMKKANARKGSVVAIDSQTGAVRAMVSLPSYDNNLFAQGIDSTSYNELLQDPDQPLFNRSISGEYPSGSTLKPIIAYGALTEHVVGEHTSFLSAGGIGINQWYFPDWKPGGHGMTDVRKAIAESVNTYFYIIGGGYKDTVGLGVERISQYARRFGFGTPTNIELTGEADGFLPSKEWKQETKGEAWYIGDTYHLAIGQGDFLTTPLQLAVAISAIANGGSLVQPYLIDAVGEGETQSVLAHPSKPVENLDAYALSVVRSGMRQTITQGSARSMLSLTQEVAGKTGTAETPGDKPYHSWFVGFGPYEHPDLTLVVLVEEGGESNAAAVLLARSIFDWWFSSRTQNVVQ